MYELDLSYQATQTTHPLFPASMSNQTILLKTIYIYIFSYILHTFLRVELRVWTLSRPCIYTAFDTCERMWNAAVVINKRSVFRLCIQSLPSELFQSEWYWNNRCATLIAALLLSSGPGCIWLTAPPFFWCGCLQWPRSPWRAMVAKNRWEGSFILQTQWGKNTQVSARDATCVKVIHSFRIVATGPWSPFQSLLRCISYYRPFPPSQFAICAGAQLINVLFVSLSGQRFQMLACI